MDVNPAITFAADGKSIFCFAGTEANNIIWRQLLVRAAPAVKVVSLPGRLIAWMKPSPDGKKLGLALGTPSSEAVIIHATR